MYGRWMERHDRSTRIVIGLFLVAIGGAMLLEQMGVVGVPEFWTLWPLMPMGLGLAMILTRKGDDRWGGYWLLVVGLFGAVNVWHLFGFNWSNSWPLMVIAAGVMILFRRSGPDDQRQVKA